MAKLLGSCMSLPLSLGRTLLVRRFVASNRKEEDGQQLKFPFLPFLETLQSEAVATAMERVFWFVCVNARKRLKVWPLNYLSIQILKNMGN